MPPPFADPAIAKRHEDLRTALKGPDVVRLGTSPADATPAETYFSGNNLIVDLEAAGLTKGDFTISVGNGLVTVVTKKLAKRPAGSLPPTSSERPFGTFMRTFPLPADANVAGIKARYQSGFLRVTIPVQAVGGAAAQPVPVT